MSSESSDPSASISSPPCRVCGGRGQGAHFGIDSCRPCAAFFHRCLRLKRVGSCRGEGRCDIGKSDKRSCRRCRYEKCLEVGMGIEGSSQPLEEPSTSSNCDESDSVNPCSTFPSASSDEYHLLRQISEKYTKLIYDRRQIELDVFPDESISTNSNPFHTNYRLMTHEHLSVVLKGIVPLIANFCTSLFPEMNELSESLKWEQFRFFLLPLHLMEGVCRGSRTPGAHNLRRYILVTGYIDTTTWKKKFDDSIEGVVKDSLCNMIVTRGFDNGWGQMVSLFSRVNPNDIELAAMIGLLLWSPRLISTTQSFDDLCTAMRERIFRQLHVYYRNTLRVEYYASRIGDLIALISAAQDDLHKKREFMTLILMFNIFGKDSYLHSLFHG